MLRSPLPSIGNVVRSKVISSWSFSSKTDSQPIILLQSLERLRYHIRRQGQFFPGSELCFMKMRFRTVRRFSAKWWKSHRNLLSSSLWVFMFLKLKVAWIISYLETLEQSQGSVTIPEVNYGNDFQGIAEMLYCAENARTLVQLSLNVG